MKRILAAAVAVALVGAAAALARPDAPPTKTPGVLVVGLDPPAVNFQVGTLRAEKVINPRGYEIDLAKAIGAQLGITNIQWLHVPFTGLFRPGPKAFDFAFEESTITSVRKRAVDFSAPYFRANQGVLLSKGTTVPTSLDDLRQLQTCGQAVTTGLDYINHKLHPTKQPLVYQTTAAAFTAVAAGRCEAFVMDVPIIASQKKTKPSAYGPIAGQIVTNENYGAVLEKGSALTPFVSRAIRTLDKNGTNARLQKKWFNVNFAKIPVLK